MLAGEPRQRRAVFQMGREEVEPLKDLGSRSLRELRQGRGSAILRTPR